MASEETKAPKRRVLGHTSGVFVALMLATGAQAQNPESLNNAPRTFQAIAGTQTVFALDTQLTLWTEVGSGTSPNRQEVDGKVWTFQAIDSDTAFVLHTDGGLWLEKGPFGASSANRQMVDSRVAAFVAVDRRTLLVLDTAGSLWLESAPFGQVLPPKRTWVDANLTAFQALDGQTFLVLRKNAELWLLQGGAFPTQLKVARNVWNFQAADPQHLLVLKNDGSLWLEQPPYFVPVQNEAQIDGNVRAVQSVPGSGDVCVLGSDGKLWVEQPPFNSIPPTRQLVDSEVRSFQALDTGNIYVLKTSGRLSLEQAPFGPSHSTQVDPRVLQVPRDYSPVPPSFFAVAAWDPLGDFPPLKFGALGHATFAWGAVQPSSSTDANFAAIDNVVNTAKQAGMWDRATNTVNIAITLGLTPEWAVDDAEKGTCRLPAGDRGAYLQCAAAPKDLSYWTNFMSMMMVRYNGITQPNIRYYELWNEANDTGWWSGSKSAAYSYCTESIYCPMVALAQAAYAIIHLNPYSMLLTPSVTGPVGTVATNSGVTWMNAYLAAGGSQYADGGAFHGYLAVSNGKDPTQPVVNPYPMPEQDSTQGCTAFVTCYGSIITKATELRGVFDNYLPGKPMLQTEGSWGEGNILDFTTQLEWLSRYYLIQAGLRSDLNLQMSSWFAWGIMPKPWGVIECPGYLPDPAGCQQPPQTPAAQAYSQIFNWVAGAAIPERCLPSSPDIWTCTMSRAMGYTATAAWYTGSNQQAPYQPGAGYTQYRCLDGAGCLNGDVLPIPAGGTVALGPAPVLFESHAKICLLYDPSKPVNAGATIPIRLYPCDASGTDLASPAAGLKVTGVIPGGVGVGGNFRFDGTLGPSGGYIYNLDTTGLAPGTYNLQFNSVTGDEIVDSITLSAPFQVK